MSTRQIEMTWRCSSCEAQNLGRFKSCQSCHSPKDGSEKYEMPADTSKAVSVTDEALLRMATAGPDWRCAYCGSDQRRHDLGCSNCGADAASAATPADDGAPPEPEEPSDEYEAETSKVGRRVLLGTIALVALLSVAVGASRYAAWNANRPREYDARVVDVSWDRSVEIERYVSKAHEGFAEDVPAGALQKKSLGQRQHHVEQVFDHLETEHYTEEVSDGFRSESYTVEESCGETCTHEAQSCSEKCTSNKNGFATCKQVCRGGGEHCSTKYCTRSRTRQIPLTKTVSRTRQVQRFRAVPRFAEAFGWSTWEWVHQRTEHLSGTDVNVRWPETHLKQCLLAGEDEREASRREALVGVLQLDEKTAHHFRFDDEARFVTFAPGSRHRVHVENGRLTVDGVAMQPTR